MLDIDRTSKKNKWTLMKYIKDFDLMVLYADAVRSGNSDVSDDALRDILKGMELENLYSPRFGKPSVHTIQFKICQIVYYMFGYKLKIKGNKVEKVVFSPLGNLLLDHKNDKKFVSRIFVCMLFGMPFTHPFNKMHKSFNIYPYRLIFKLLTDKRIDYKLNHDEVFYYVMFYKNIDAESYTELVNQILFFRALSNSDKYDLFTKRKDIEDVLANALHEWNYASGVLQQAGILSWHQADDNFGVLTHGNESGRRRYKSDSVKLEADIFSFVSLLVSNYSYEDKPQNLTEQLQLNSEYIIQLYNYYPEELIKELGIDSAEQEKIISILKITDEINRYARNSEDGDSYKFEDALCDAFNYFSDVEAKKHAQAGTTDIECIYTPLDLAHKKFDVEAKSTKNKLMNLSAGRLRAHREQVGSQYTIVVTPNYINAVLEDIKGTPTVLIRSGSFSNFLYQSISNLGRDIRYETIDKMVLNNLGKDITDGLNQYVYENFGVSTQK
jgi:type II restriction enzyme